MDPIENGDNSESTELHEKPSFDDLPAEVRQKIISYFPGRHWPTLELVSRGFRDDILASWSSLKKVDLFKYFEWTPFFRRSSENSRCLLRMIYNRAPNIMSIRGLNGAIMELDSDMMVDMARFRKLESVSFKNCAVRVADLATFLRESRSRSSLEELIIEHGGLGLVDDDNIDDDDTAAEDQLLRQAFIDGEGRPSLELRVFIFENDHRQPQGLLGALNVNRLEKLTIVCRNTSFPLHDVVELLGRCTELKELCFDTYTMNLETFVDALKLFPCRSLQKLELRRGEALFDPNRTPTETLRQLAYQHPDLEILDLHEEKFESSGDALSIFAQGFKNLAELRFDVEQIELDVVTRTLPLMERLERLYLYDRLQRFECLLHNCDSDYAYVNVDILQTVATSMQRLTKFHVDLPDITSHQVTVLRQLTQLRELSIYVDRRVNDGLAVICSLLEHLHAHLDLELCYIVEHQLVFALEDKTTRIRRLVFSFSDFTDIGLQAIANACPLLEELDIHECKEVTASGIRDLVRKCKKLVDVKVRASLPDLLDLKKEWPFIIGCELG